MKKEMKVLKVLVTMGMMLVMMSSFVFAESTIGEITPKIPDFIKNVLPIVAGIVWAVAIIMILYLAAKYMMSGANEKADVKTSSIRMAIGLIIAAFAVQIVTWAIGMAS